MKRLIFGVAVLLALVAICVYRSISNTPSASEMRSPEPAVSAAAVQPVALQNDYFSATLPGEYTVKEQRTNEEVHELLQIIANEQALHGQQVAIGVDTLPAEGLDGVASYILRTKNPDMYMPVEFGGMPVGVPTFWRQTATNYEIVGFWRHDSLYASIAVSGLVSDKQHSNQAFLQILDSWRWL